MHVCELMDRWHRDGLVGAIEPSQWEAGTEGAKVRTEQATFSMIRELYSRISSIAPKERLYRQLKPTEVSDLIEALEPRENPEAVSAGGIRHIIEKTC